MMLRWQIFGWVTAMGNQVQPVQHWHAADVDCNLGSVVTDHGLLASLAHKNSQLAMCGHFR